MRRRVVITGTGLVSRLGESPRFVHNQLCHGAMGLHEIDDYALYGLQRQLAGRMCSFDARAHLKEKPLRPLDRTGQLLASAAQLALANAGWTPQDLRTHDVGLVLGTMFGSMRTIAKFDQQALHGGPASASPMDFANTVINSAAGQTAIWHKLRGINSTTATGSTSGLMAIGYAADLIASRAQTAVLAGGTDEFCLEALCALHRAGLLCGSTCNGGCAVPFDARRTGLALAEAAGLLMLEDPDFASARGAPILAEILGHANACQPSWEHPGHGPDALIRAMRGAMEDSSVAPDEIDCISASANGSVAQDGNEARAIKAVFNGNSRSVVVTAIKSMLGETLGAAGALQSIDLIESMRSSMIPAIAGLQRIDPELDVLNFCREPTVARVRLGLVNGVGLDGHACSLIIAAPRL